MILQRFTKQPEEVKDYDIDYSVWLAQIEDTLDHIETDIINLTDPTDTALEIAADPPMTITRVKLWISGGTPGHKYKVTVKAFTVAGRLDEVELVFKIKDY